MKFKVGDWVTVIKILENEPIATKYTPCIGIAAQIMGVCVNSAKHNYLLDIGHDGQYIDEAHTGWFERELRKATEEEIKKAKSNRVAERL